MKECNSITRPHEIILFVLLVAYGCTSPVLNMPESMPDVIKEYKNITVRSNVPYLINSGIHIRKGDLFSILAKGQIKRYPHSDLWQGPGTRLAMTIGGNIVTHNGYDTIKSEFEGEIKLGVVDGPFDYRRGQAEKPEWYKNNFGYFDVDLIVWQTKSYSQIAEFLSDMQKEDPDNIIIKSAFGYLNQYEKIELARKETSNEIEKNRKLLHELKDKSQAQEKPLNWSARHNEKITEVESKLAQLIKNLEQLDEMKKQLDEEKRKANRLSIKLKKKKEKERQLLRQIARFPQRPAGLLISSPEDGNRTEGANVLLTGVAEDENGLKRIKILLNNKLLDILYERGNNVSEKAFPKRFYLNKMIPLAVGENRINIMVINMEGLLSEKILTVYRVKKRRRVWAVIVGINDYDKIPKLKFAVNDAKSFYDLLVNFNQIPKENVKLIVNEEATLKNLRSILGTDLKSNAGKEDMVLIYFAGHGATEPDALSPDGDGLEKYLLPYDSDLNDLYASALPMREILHIFRRIQSQSLIFLADACYSGASGGRTASLSGIRANISDAFLNRIANGKGKVVITASGINEVSLEEETLQHGVFTYFLIEALRGNADMDHDGLITADETYNYVYEKVTKATNQEQHPVKIGKVEGDLVLSIMK